MSGHLLRKKAQSDESSLPRFGKRNESAFFSDTKSSQPEPRCRNTRDRGGVIGPHIASILYQPSLRAGLFPKVPESLAFSSSSRN